MNLKFISILFVGHGATNVGNSSNIAVVLEVPVVKFNFFVTLSQIHSTIIEIKVIALWGKGHLVARWVV